MPFRLQQDARGRTAFRCLCGDAMYSRFICFAALALAGLLCLSSPAYAIVTWYELTSENFRLITNDSSKKARALLLDLERFRFFLGQITDVDINEDPAPLRIFALSTNRNYHYVFPDRGSAGVYFSRPGGATFVFSMEESAHERGTDRRQVLFHEYVHHFLNQFSPLRYPTWYQEGFAEYLSTFEYNDDVITIGKPSLLRVGYLSKNHWLSFKDLMAANLGYLEGWEHGRSNQIMLYAQGWFFTHYLQTHEDQLPKLQDYIIRLNRGEDYESAFQTAFDTTFDDMEERLDKYWENMQMPYIQYRVNDAINPDIQVRKMPPAEGKYQYAEAVLATNLADQRSNIVRKKIEQALKIDPNDIHARLLQGEIELEEKQFDEAAEIYEFVLARQPENQRALMLKGNALYQKAQLEDVPEESQRVMLQEARSIMHDIIAHNPKNSGAHFGLIKVNLAEVMSFNYEEAFSSYRTVKSLVPGLQMEYVKADMHIRSGQYEEAKQDLERFRLWSDNDSFQQSIDKKLEEIEKLIKEGETSEDTQETVASNQPL